MSTQTTDQLATWLVDFFEQGWTATSDDIATAREIAALIRTPSAPVAPVSGERPDEDWIGQMMGDPSKLATAPAPPWTSASCGGEKCTMCSQPASAKVGEEIMHDDPAPNRHNLTAYLCTDHFNAVLRPYLLRAAAPVAVAPQIVCKRCNDSGNVRAGFGAYMLCPDCDGLPVGQGGRVLEAEPERPDIDRSQENHDEPFPVAVAGTGERERVHAILHEFSGRACPGERDWCDARDHADTIIAALAAPAPVAAPREVSGWCGMGDHKACATSMCQCACHEATAQPEPSEPDADAAKPCDDYRGKGNALSACGQCGFTLWDHYRAARLRAVQPAPSEEALPRCMDSKDGKHVWTQACTECELTIDEVRRL